MKPTRKQIGAQGERLAAEHLQRKGYEMVGANWHCPPHGEIDLIARQGETLVFVEVRTRRSGAEAAFASISPRKRRTLEALAYLYVEAHDLSDDWRVDVIAVALPMQGEPLIEHVENALDW